jgi:predicted AAA+ superfamily ATPase
MAGMQFVPRALGVTIRRACRSFPAVLVTGPRQSGKTTLLRHEFGSSHGFVSLERPDVRSRAQADPLSFLAEHRPPVIVDEIQFAPELLHYIKERIDENRQPGAWLLTGSQSFQLMRGVSQTLAGRVAVLTLDPFSVREALRDAAAPGIDAVLERVYAAGGAKRSGAVGAVFADWLLRGGYPELRLSAAVDRQLWFAGYVQTYLQRDVRDLLQVGDLNTFSRFLSLAAARSGMLLNLADLARDVGVAAPTIRRWLSVLEASGVVYLLRPYHRNFGKRLIKSPKLIFADVGLAAFLTGLHDPEAALKGPSLGALAETAVVGEWLKLFRQHGEDPALFFWRSAPGVEVDLLIERNRRLYAVEVKATATPTPAHAASLAQWLALAGRTAQGVLACRVEQPMALAPRIRAVPWHLAWW